MTNVVSDVSGNRNEKIANAAEFLKRSRNGKSIFKAIYSGKRAKKISEIEEISELSKVRVLQVCQKLYGEDLIDREDKKKDNEIVYVKKDFYNHNCKKILNLANNPKKIDKIPTKSNPSIRKTNIVKIFFPKKFIDIQEVSIDDIDSFSKVKKIKTSIKEVNILESEIKELIKKVIGESGDFKDWPGEKNDIFTTKLRYKGKRHSVAFALKGRGLRGKLFPGNMGKRGDQIQRLFSSPAEFFIIQYVRQIDEAVLDLMKQLAMAKSVSENRKIFFGIIDGQDTKRILEAYGSS